MNDSGDDVHYVGKPCPEVYAYCRAIFDAHSVRRIVAIGDFLQHGVARGNAAGFDTIFISNGIHREHWRSPPAQTQRERLAELFRAYDDSEPTWMLSALRW